MDASFQPSTESTTISYIDGFLFDDVEAGVVFALEIAGSPVLQLSSQIVRYDGRIERFVFPAKAGDGLWLALEYDRADAALRGPPASDVVFEAFLYLLEVLPGGVVGGEGVDQVGGLVDAGFAPHALLPVAADVLEGVGRERAREVFALHSKNINLVTAIICNKPEEAINPA